jgi:hypothetical protein
LHQLPKICIDAAATLQLSRLAHPFCGVKRLLMQLNRLAPGLRQQNQQQQLGNGAEWRGFYPRVSHAFIYSLT